MKCLHCLIDFHHQEKLTVIGKDVDGGWVVSRSGCPSCKRTNLKLLNAEYKSEFQRPIYDLQVIEAVPIRPKGSNRPPCPSEVPQDLAEDYTEACLVLSLSPKASSALSRRCLQNVLRNAAGVKHGNLANEIQEVIDGGHLPSHLADVIDAVRQTGNFAAHPIKSQVTGQILPVEPHEADWNLDVLESLFDFYYVQPAVIAKKRAALNAKLSEAGKPPMK